MELQKRGERGWERKGKGEMRRERAKRGTIVYLCRVKGSGGSIVTSYAEFRWTGLKNTCQVLVPNRAEWCDVPSCFGAGGRWFLLYFSP